MDKESLDFVFNNCPCINLGKALRSSTRYFDDLLAPYSINASKLILLVSIQRLNGATQKQLTDDLSIQQSSLSRSLKDLVSKKWINYKASKQGTKSIKKIVLTKKGLLKLGETAPIWEEGYNKLITNPRKWSEVIHKLETINK